MVLEVLVQAPTTHGWQFNLYPKRQKAYQDWARIKEAEIALGNWHRKPLVTVIKEETRDHFNTQATVA